MVRFQNMRSSRRISLYFAVAVALVTTGCSDETGGAAGAGGQGGQGGLGGESGQGGEPGPTTTAASTASVASVSTATTGGGTVDCPDGGYATFDQSDECDMLQQDCEPGFTCVRKRLAGVTSTTCEARGGLKGIASECEIDAECESGLFCIFNVCTPVCCPENDEPCDGGLCNLNLQYSQTDSIRVCTYSKQCTPLTEDACPAGSGCHFEEPTAATCIQGSGENVPEGGTCTVLNDCANMQQCTGAGICRWICALEDNGEEPGLGGCLDGQSCVESPAIGAIGIGVCAPD